MSSFAQVTAAAIAGPVGYMPILLALVVLVHHEVVRVVRADEHSPPFETKAIRITRLLVVAMAFGFVTLRLMTLAS